MVGGYKDDLKIAVEKLVMKGAENNEIRHFKRKDGTIKSIYIEPRPEKRQAAESILRAMEILLDEN
jgi:hypothetical protein